MKQYITAIMSEAEAAGFALTPSNADVLLRHLNYVIEANSRVRLTAIDSLESGVRLHIIDSILALPELTSAPPGTAIDIGTGGGYPGIPMALLSGRRFVLADSVRKKVSAVAEYLAAEDGIGQVSTVAARAEELAADSAHRASYGVVVARALSALPSLVELAAPLLVEGGHLIAMKGGITQEELDRGTQASAVCGMSLKSVRRFELPSSGEQRSVIVYEKIGAATIDLPRRTGLAQRKPLA